MDPQAREWEVQGFSVCRVRNDQFGSHFSSYHQRSHIRQLWRPLSVPSLTSIFDFAWRVLSWRALRLYSPMPWTIQSRKIQSLWPQSSDLARNGGARNRLYLPRRSVELRDEENERMPSLIQHIINQSLITHKSAHKSLSACIQASKATTLAKSTANLSFLIW